MPEVSEGNFASQHNQIFARPIKVAVLLPCYNEAQSIAAVIEEFRCALPTARLYVYDNNSKDGSAEIAHSAGAIVRSEPRQGKGFVVRRMFADVEADIFVMCDADDTYEISVVPKMIELLISSGLDMVVGARSAISGTAYRPGHKFGNLLLSSLVRRIFGDGFQDMLSGYRVFSRRFVKSFPVMSQGFEIETELTIHALELEMPSAEVATQFKDRAEGSESKLRTLSDGLRILWTIGKLLKQERPMGLLGIVALLLAILSLVLAYPLLIEYLATGLVPRLPTALLSTGIMLLAYLSLFSGLILDTVTRGRQEAKRLRYLELPSIHATMERDASPAA
jgi:glycosyltransferase involved in cell wall biosynthesis